jgi:hypothetical protein
VRVFAGGEVGGAGAEAGAGAGGGEEAVVSRWKSIATGPIQKNTKHTATSNTPLRLRGKPTIGRSVLKNGRAEEGPECRRLPRRLEQLEEDSH